MVGDAVVSAREECIRRLLMCASCGKPCAKNTPYRNEPRLRRCGGCSSRSYCDPICARADWPSHKNLCKRLKKERKARVAAEKQAAAAASDATAGWNATPGVVETMGALGVSAPSASEASFHGQEIMCGRYCIKAPTGGKQGGWFSNIELASLGMLDLHNPSGHMFVHKMAMSRPGFPKILINDLGAYNEGGPDSLRRLAAGEDEAEVIEAHARWLFMKDIRHSGAAGSALEKTFNFIDLPRRWPNAEGGGSGDDSTGLPKLK